MNDTFKPSAASITDDEIKALEHAARAATPQDIDSAEKCERYEDGSHIECPACAGEGHVPLEADFCNYDGLAIGVQFYGVGDEPGAAEAYFRAARPTAILALISRLECAEAAVAASSLRRTPSAWLHATEPREAISDLRKREMMENAGAGEQLVAGNYSIPAYARSAAGDSSEAKDGNRDENVLSWLRGLSGTSGRNTEAIRHIEDLYDQIADKAIGESDDNHAAKALARDAVTMLEGHANRFRALAMSKEGDGRMICVAIAQVIRRNMIGWFGTRTDSALLR